MSVHFRTFGLREELLRAIGDAGFEEPTPIQKKAVPVLLDGHDLIGVAETGTGKTLAYLLPILNGLELEQRDPQAIVICPTRELALQVGKEAERFGGHLGLRSVVAYGGTSSADQKKALSEGRHLVVATPGRLLDFVNSAWLTMRRVRWLVLDEADRMLDMGFINDVDAILRRVPMSRQTMLFSATFPEALRRLSERYMFHPEMVRMHTGTRVAVGVDHAIYPVSERYKPDLLIEILGQERPAKTLIFTATREGTSELAIRLRRAGYEVVSLSSLLSQANRERVLAAFRAGEIPVLVATDVAARGLDITDIDLVVNYDAPSQAEDYVHRIGRTGRALRTGRAVMLATDKDQRRVAEIERLLGERIERVELEGFARSSRPGRGRASGKRGRRTGAAARSEEEPRPKRKRRSRRRSGGRGRSGE